MRLFFLFNFISILLLSNCSALTYSEWSNSPEIYKRGYLMGFYSGLIQFAFVGDEVEIRRKWMKCLVNAKANDFFLMQQVERTVVQKPDLAVQDMSVVVSQAFGQMCGWGGK